MAKRVGEIDQQCSNGDVLGDTIMPHLPRVDGIIEDVINVFALANTYHITAVSQDKLNLYQFVRDSLQNRGDCILIERLLALAVKIRFLDDNTKLLGRHDRHYPFLISYSESNCKEDKIGVRFALNKLIHHKTILVGVDKHSAIVVRSIEEGPENGPTIPQGSHDESAVKIMLSGNYGGVDWDMGINLFVLLNEILRICYLEEEITAR